MNEENIRIWLVEKFIKLSSQALLKSAETPSGFKFTIHELINHIEVVASEAELRIINPNFPESNE